MSGDVAEQRYLGVTFEDGYDYPMRRIPPSWSDRELATGIDGLEVTVGTERISLKVRGYPAARNGVPRAGYRPQGAIDIRDRGVQVEQSLGERCAGNTACTPICPIQARYHAGKTLAGAIEGGLQVRAQAVASTIVTDPADGTVQRIEYKRYDDPASTAFTPASVTARVYVLAAHTIENAKLLLASGIAGGGVGRGLMDHPALYAWGWRPGRSAPSGGRSRPPASRIAAAAASAASTRRSATTSATTAGAPPPARPTPPWPTRC